VKNFIDERAYAQFKQLGLFPSEPCSDAEFLRRASLDTIGALPTSEEARAFLADTAPTSATISSAGCWSTRSTATTGRTNGPTSCVPIPIARASKASTCSTSGCARVSRPTSRTTSFVRDIVTTEGNTHRFGPAVIYRDRREPADITTMFSQLFLGVRLDCAKCHHHPSEKWGQDDFYRMAAFFGSVKQKGAGSPRRSPRAMKLSTLGRASR